MTVEQAQQALPGVTFRAGTDGDGAALIMVTMISVTRGTILWMHLYPAADPRPGPAAPKIIEAIRVFDPACATPEGIHVGMTLAQVERRLGPLIEVVMGEIESREFATFPRLPRWLLLQADNGGATAGVYEHGKRTTRKYAGGSTVQSLWLNERSPGRTHE
jgi:hypothetical protein